MEVDKKNMSLDELVKQKKSGAKPQNGGPRSNTPK